MLTKEEKMGMSCSSQLPSRNEEIKREVYRMVDRRLKECGYYDVKNLVDMPNKKNKRGKDMFNATIDEVIRLKGNYDRLVEQNRSLQFELKEKSMDITWNWANDINYGEFVLKRHSWCHSLNTANTVGFIDVEYIADKHRRIYVGIGEGYDFNADVLNVAKYGTCIKDCGYGE